MYPELLRICFVSSEDTLSTSRKLVLFVTFRGYIQGYTEGRDLPALHQIKFLSFEDGLGAAFNVKLAVNAINVLAYGAVGNY